MPAEKPYEKKIRPLLKEEYRSALKKLIEEPKNIKKVGIRSISEPYQNAGFVSHLKEVLKKKRA